jgi:hypothetical protein
VGTSHFCKIYDESRFRSRAQAVCLNVLVAHYASHGMVIVVVVARELKTMKLTKFREGHRVTYNLPLNTWHGRVWITSSAASGGTKPSRLKTGQRSACTSATLTACGFDHYVISRRSVP